VPCNDNVILNSTALKQFSNAENAGQITIATAKSFFNQSARECNITKIEVFAVLPSPNTGSSGTVSTNVTIDTQGNVVLNTTAPLHHQVFTVFIAAKANNGTAFASLSVVITADCST